MMNKMRWTMVATLFAMLAMLWVTYGASFAAKQAGVEQLTALAGWGPVVAMMTLMALSIGAGMRAPK